MGKAKAPNAGSRTTRRRPLRARIRISPQKLNLVAALIRGKKVDRALAELEFSRKRIAGTVKKTLESAIANAENNHDLDVDASGRCRSLCRQVDRHEAFPRSWPRPCSAYREAVLAPHDRRSRSRKRGGRIMGQKINPIGLRLGINRTWD